MRVRICFGFVRMKGCFRMLRRIGQRSEKEFHLPLLESRFDVTLLFDDFEVDDKSLENKPAKVTKNKSLQTISIDEEDVDEIKKNHHEVYKSLENFSKGKSKEIVEFSKNLTADARRVVHTVCKYFNIYSESFGDELSIEGRRVRVSNFAFPSLDAKVKGAFVIEICDTSPVNAQKRTLLEAYKVPWIEVSALEAQRWKGGNNPLPCMTAYLEHTPSGLKETIWYCQECKTQGNVYFTRITSIIDLHYGPGEDKQWPFTKRVVFSVFQKHNADVEQNDNVNSDDSNKKPGTTSFFLVRGGYRKLRGQIADYPAVLVRKSDSEKDFDRNVEDYIAREEENLLAKKGTKNKMEVVLDWPGKTPSSSVVHEEDLDLMGKGGRKVGEYVFKTPHSIFSSIERVFRVKWYWNNEERGWETEKEMFRKKTKLLMAKKTSKSN